MAHAPTTRAEALRPGPREASGGSSWATVAGLFRWREGPNRGHDHLMRIDEVDAEVGRAEGGFPRQDEPRESCFSTAPIIAGEDPQTRRPKLSATNAQGCGHEQDSQLATQPRACRMMFRAPALARGVAGLSLCGRTGRRTPLGPSRPRAAEHHVQPLLPDTGPPGGRPSAMRHERRCLSACKHFR